MDKKRYSKYLGSCFATRFDIFMNWSCFFLKLDHLFGLFV